MHDSEVCLDKNNDYFVPIYSDMVRIYNAALHTKMNGEKYILPPLKKKWKYHQRSTLLFIMTFLKYLIKTVK